jgi:hypothetical protein
MVKISIEKLEIGWGVWSNKQLLVCCKTVKQVLSLLEKLMIEDNYPCPPILKSSGLARLIRLNETNSLNNDL